MEIDWSGLIWESRWTALEILWNSIIVNIATHWWFGPLLFLLLVAAGWNGLVRLGLYVARVFAHTQ
ncbi:hypothetical protein B1729_03605 [Microbacterium sp. B35-04]|uniref:hypothetical protein n=1 Tax=unclassified Microbacterium TaxID=2609290 RepID=UPI0013D53E80|nr:MULTISPECIES: hypothetical protein [unclassified Microbacterium]KAF2414676.1 hypothetical protein B1729_03605 [Microbacterium sp. B35-04]KAF2417608.1 hypothetical protein B2K11_11795 [Microbacterium sp. B35-30]